MHPKTHSHPTNTPQTSPECPKHHTVAFYTRGRSNNGLFGGGGVIVWKVVKEDLHHCTTTNKVGSVV
jgi:hypothetical protein